MAHIILPFFPCLIYYTSKLPKSNHWLHKGTVYHKWIFIFLRHHLSCPWIPYVSSLILLKKNCLIEIRHQFYQLLKETKRWKPEPLKKKFLWNTIVPTKIEYLQEIIKSLIINRQRSNLSCASINLGCTINIS